LDSRFLAWTDSHHQTNIIEDSVWQSWNFEGLKLWCLKADIFNFRSQDRNTIYGIKKERESGSLRVAALKALGNIGDGRALELLLAALGDSSVGFRRVAASSLGNFRDPSAIAPLIEALQDEDNWVRIDARYSLEKLTGQDFENYNAWSEWNSQR
jgi:HEAT repeats